MENRKELTAEDVKKVNGGLVVQDEAEKKYWVVGQDGKVLGPAPDEKAAILYAKILNTSPKVITMEEYKKIFGRDLVW